MAESVQIELQGMKQLVATLEQIGADVESVVEQIALAAAEPVARAIEAKAPGDIGQSIVTATTEKSKKRVTVSVGPDKTKWYAGFVERGTASGGTKILTRNGRSFAINGPDAKLFRTSINHQGMAAQPFMRPAFDETQGEAQAKAGEKVAEVIGA